MGNNLGKLAHGYGLAWWLERDFGGLVANSSIVLRHQEHAKWVRGRDAIAKCFPNARGWDFEAGNIAEFTERQEEQTKWLKPELASAPAGKTKDEIDSFLQELLVLRGHEKARPAGKDNNRTISLPFIYANSLDEWTVFTDRFYDELRKLFRFDESCCKLKPDADESVFVSVNSATDAEPVYISI